MHAKRFMTLLTAAALLALPLAGCEQLPGEPETQGTAIGAVGGAAAGAALADDSPWLGAAIGGAAGGAAGYYAGRELGRDDDDVVVQEREVRRERIDGPDAQYQYDREYDYNDPYD